MVEMQVSMTTGRCPVESCFERLKHSRLASKYFYCTIDEYCMTFLLYEPTDTVHRSPPEGGAARTRCGSLKKIDPGHVTVINEDYPDSVSRQDGLDWCGACFRSEERVGGY